MGQVWGRCGVELPPTFLRTLPVGPTAPSRRLPLVAAGPASATARCHHAARPRQPCQPRGQHPPSAAPPCPGPREPALVPLRDSRPAGSAPRGTRPRESAPAEPHGPARPRAGPCGSRPGGGLGRAPRPPSRCGRAPARVPAARGGA